jgi:hypothetical protein
MTTIYYCIIILYCVVLIIFSYRYLVQYDTYNLMHPWSASETGGTGGGNKRRRFIEQMQTICIVSMEISTNRREKIGSIRSAPCAIS